ncbi:hypothetical protein RIF29_19461 [Crotalaria pallida]|uniref:Uncharacterized protein n=1 Tax=Crotalaria pallida TaxID=3830 RepID=A0AAN9F3U4_CROPI
MDENYLYPWFAHTGENRRKSFRCVLCRASKGLLISFEVLKPATRNKLKIEGHMYQKLLSDNLFALPSYIGGSCTCMKCSELSNWDMLQQHHATTGTIIRDEDSDISDDEDSSSLQASNGSEISNNLFGDYEHMLRTVIIGSAFATTPRKLASSSIAKELSSTCPILSLRSYPAPAQSVMELG